MRKDEAWAKEQLEYYIKAVGDPFNNRTQGMIDAYKNVEHIINQLDEPEKIVIPQFVADYIENYKGREYSLGTWLHFVYVDEFERKTKEWIYSGSYEENLKREYLLIDAIRYGYEVEKEKEYRVVFRSHKDDLILFKTGEHIFIGAESANGGYWKQHFTESEIKAIDKRYWDFAEEITE